MKTIKTLVKIIVIFLATVTNANAYTFYNLDLSYHYIGGDNVEVKDKVSYFSDSPALVNNWGNTIWVGQAFTDEIPCNINSHRHLPNENGKYGDYVKFNHQGIENLKIELTFKSWAEDAGIHYNEVTGKYSGVTERPLDIYLISWDPNDPTRLIDKPEDEYFVETVYDKSDWTQHTVDITTAMLNFINNGKEYPTIVFGGATKLGKVRAVSIEYTYTINPDYNKTDNNTTAVNEVMSINANNDVYYDLSGKMITTPVKGRMYIKNGKLAIVK